MTNFRYANVLHVRQTHLENKFPNSFQYNSNTTTNTTTTTTNNNNNNNDNNNNNNDFSNLSSQFLDMPEVPHVKKVIWSFNDC